MPEEAWGGRVHAELARSPARAALGAALRLSWGWSDFSTFPGLAGEAKFRLRSGRLEGCARVSREPFVVSPCAAFEIGTLSGTTPSLRPASSTTLWTAAGAIVRGGVELTHWLSIELEAGVFIPFERRGFVLTAPYRSVYEPPLFFFDAGAGLSVGSRFY
jgi:hypothetical protein